LTALKQLLASKTEASMTTGKKAAAATTHFNTLSAVMKATVT
jgi:hypothetical protein